MQTYEALFLVEPTVAAREYPKVSEEIERIVKKSGGAMIQCNRWGERKLAFPVRKCARGTYVLAYFAADGKAITPIRRDFGISEIVLRSIMLSHEGAMAVEPSKDFEIAGPIPPKRDFSAGGGFVPREGSAGYIPAPRGR